MEISGWKNWTLADWNLALVREVFLNAERVDIPITRIDASDRLLSKCVGSELLVAGVRDYFITSFGDSASSIRSKFKYRGIYKYQTKEKDIPPIFAHAFLTLLAGSADANSINIGQFRLRFSELFKNFYVGELAFEDLPKFWDLISQWSLDRKERIGDCRVLHLTYQGRETLIGNSKKLAFPGYSDEKLLSGMLDPDNLDFGQVQAIISRNINTFSDPFKEEFYEFVNYLLRSDLKGAYETPLWGVVQDLSFDSQHLLTSKLGSYFVEVSVGISNVDFYVCTDLKGREFLQESFAFLEDVSNKGNNFLLDIKKEQGFASVLTRMSSKYQDLQRLKLWKQFNCELIPFFPDDGYLTTKGIFSEGDRCCLLIKKRLYETIRNSKLRFSKEPICISARDFGDDWTLLYFDSIKYNELQDFIPERLRRVMGLSWKPPQISLRDGAKFGQIYLLNPASNPRFEGTKFDSGLYEIFFHNNKPSRQGSLNKVENFFQIPPIDLTLDLESVSRVEYKAYLVDTGRVVSKNISVIDRSPKSNSFDFNYSDKWVLTGRDGTLVSANELFSPRAAQLPADARSFDHIKPYFINSNESCSNNAANVVNCTLESRPLFLQWLAECLSLRFQKRASIQYGELIQYTQDVSNIIGVKNWRLRNILFLGGWLWGLQDRSYQSFVPHLSQRTISILASQDFFVCRVVGLFNQAEEFEMKSILAPEESISRFQDLTNILSIGAIEIRVKTLSKIQELIQRFSLIKLDIDAYGSPLSENGIKLAKSISVSLPKFEGLTKFSGFEWVPYENRANPDIGLLVRDKDRGRFWVYSGMYFYELGSELVAKFVQLAFKKIPLGIIYKNGECECSANIFSLPDSLTRWWLHWGGGCISYTVDGKIALVGRVSPSLWKHLGSWVLDNQPRAEFREIGLQRRGLALKKIWLKR